MEKKEQLIKAAYCRSAHKPRDNRNNYKCLAERSAFIQKELGSIIKKELKMHFARRRLEK